MFINKYRRRNNSYCNYNTRRSITNFRKIYNERECINFKNTFSKNNKYKVSEIENIVDIFFREIENALKQKKRIEIRGFGSFFIKEREKRIGINPQNGKNIEIEKKVHPKFKMGKILFKKLNPK